jgi:phage tail protein X
MLKFIKLESAAKVDDLAALAYQLKSNTAGSTLTAASEALLIANPALRDLKRLPKGSVVLVPDIGGKLPPAKEAEPVEIPLGGSGLLTDKQIASLANEVAEGAKIAKERAAETAATLKAAHKAIAEHVPDAEKVLEQILANAKAVAEAAREKEKSMRKVFEKMAEDMKRLRELQS